MVYERWTNQEEAYKFAMSHRNTMLNMDMGTGKTRVAIDVALDREDVHRVLVVCPKAVIPVWRVNLKKFAGDRPWVIWDHTKGTIKTKAESIREKHYAVGAAPKTMFVVLNYDIVWREPIGELLRRINFDMIILDESHRAKSAGSKVSKYLFLLGKPVKYKLCLSGTPMANSPLDVYGQYRFLDHTIFGTRYDLFKEQYAVLGGPERKFVVGFKNLEQLNRKFQTLAYTCKMSDIKDRLKLPDKLPPNVLEVELPPACYKLVKTLGKEFIAEYDNSGSFVVLKNVLGKILRCQQISAGFAVVQDGPLETPKIKELHTVKTDTLADYLEDVPYNESVVVFGKFKHDLDAIHVACEKAGRGSWELSGSRNELVQWNESNGDVLVVQIQSGAEGINLTKAHHAVYFNLDHSLALYEQSLARLYRPGQTQQVRFTYIIARDTVDEDIFECLQNKKDLIEEIQQGRVDFKFLR